MAKRKQLTQNEKAMIFDSCYEIYQDEFNENSEIGECPMAKEDFGERLKEVVRDEADNFD